MSESRGKQSWGKRKQGGDGNSFGNKKVKKDFKKGGYKGKKENEKPRLFGKELKEFRRSTKPHAELIADLNKQWQVHENVVTRFYSPFPHPHSTHTHTHTHTHTERERARGAVCHF